MKRAYLANGYLVQPLSEKGYVATVDAATWLYLNTLLGTDYCYLVIAGREVVKVLGLQATNQVLLQRGLEGTHRKTWIAGRSIKYGLTWSEVQDATTYIGYTLNVSGGVSWDGVNIFYPELNLLGIGGITCDGTYIDDIPDNVGCCISTEPPSIPLQYLPLRQVYLTGAFDYRITDSGDYRVYQ